MERKKRSTRKRGITRQLDADLFCNVVTPYQYEKPMLQHFLEKPKPPFLLLLLDICFHSFYFYQVVIRKKNRKELKQKQQQQERDAEFCLVDSMTRSEEGDPF